MRSLQGSARHIGVNGRCQTKSYICRVRFPHTEGRVREPPVPTIRPKEFRTHGDVRLDNFDWLKDTTRKSKDVITYIRQENEYGKGILSEAADLRHKLEGRLREVNWHLVWATRECESPPLYEPYVQEGYLYYCQVVREYKVHCRVPWTGPIESLSSSVVRGVEGVQIILDEGKRAQGSSSYHTRSISVSPGGRFVAFTDSLQEHSPSLRSYHLHIVDLLSGEEVLPAVQDSSGPLCWCADRLCLLYVANDALSIDSITLGVERCMENRGGDQNEHGMQQGIIGPSVHPNEVLVQSCSMNRVYNEPHGVAVRMSKSHGVVVLESLAANGLVVEARCLLPGDDPQGCWRVIWPQGDTDRCTVK